MVIGGAPSEEEPGHLMEVINQREEMQMGKSPSRVGRHSQAVTLKVILQPLAKQELSPLGMLVTQTKFPRHVS